MKKTEIEAKVKELRQMAKDRKMKLSIPPGKLHEDRLDCFWYGGHIGTLKYGHYDIHIEVFGDVFCLLRHPKNEAVLVRDKACLGRFYETMSPFLRNDRDLSLAIDRGLGLPGLGANGKPFPYSLEITENNWVEFNIFDNRRGQWLPLSSGMNILDSSNVLEAFSSMDLFLECVRMWEESQRKAG